MPNMVKRRPIVQAAAGQPPDLIPGNLAIVRDSVDFEG